MIVHESLATWLLISKVFELIDLIICDYLWENQPSPRIY